VKPSEIPCFEAKCKGAVGLDCSGRELEASNGRPHYHMSRVEASVSLVHVEPLRRPADECVDVTGELGFTADERAAELENPRPGVIVLPHPPSGARAHNGHSLRIDLVPPINLTILDKTYGRILTQIETDRLIACELWQAAPEHQRTELVGMFGPTVGVRCVDPKRPRSLARHTVGHEIAVRQVGGWHSEPIARAMQRRLYRVNNRAGSPTMVWDATTNDALPGIRRHMFVALIDGDHNFIAIDQRCYLDTVGNLVCTYLDDPRKPIGGTFGRVTELWRAKEGAQQLVTHDDHPCIAIARVEIDEGVRVWCSGTTATVETDEGVTYMGVQIDYDVRVEDQRVRYPLAGIPTESYRLMRGDLARTVVCGVSMPMGRAEPRKSDPLALDANGLVMVATFEEIAQGRMMGRAASDPRNGSRGREIDVALTTAIESWQWRSSGTRSLRRVVTTAFQEPPRRDCTWGIDATRSIIRFEGDSSARASSVTNPNWRSEPLGALESWRRVDGGRWEVVLWVVDSVEIRRVRRLGTVDENGAIDYIAGFRVPPNTRMHPDDLEADRIARELEAEAEQDAIEAQIAQSQQDSIEEQSAFYGGTQPHDLDGGVCTRCAWSAVLGIPDTGCENLDPEVGTAGCAACNGLGRRWDNQQCSVCNGYGYIQGPEVDEVEAAIPPTDDTADEVRARAGMGITTVRDPDGAE